MLPDLKNEKENCHTTMKTRYKDISMKPRLTPDLMNKNMLKLPLLPPDHISNLKLKSDKRDTFLD
jgi:hypothetical protein